ncbi:5-oxoprolinase subunit B family protein [Yoonia litorea]|uniref:Sensor histidine kinase inhibitor, KipI family n=1 Tax=Yoonia litorea TaxID=1123755 RepID=A0A1I6L4C1_9RHOB|nr:carboxyltransferase domain-containing protein [Yoonia litorea]SFR98267.1 sensor histidine kinase inhibitor, KipI family [Yoonia litorea]
MDEPEILPSGTDGILVRFARRLSDDANAQALAFKDRVAAAGVEGVTEVASSLVSVRVGFDPERTTREKITSSVRSLLSEKSPLDTAEKRLWRIPVAFGPDHAPQLAEAAELAGVSSDVAIREICDARLRVIAIGFAPGQPYLGMLPEHWNIARQTELTEGLPRGALITAVQQLILWAADAPTGWRHIGQTAFEVYRPDADAPFAFSPGDKVRFEAVSDSTMNDLLANSGPDGGATLEVLD